MNKRTLAVVTGTRADYGLLSGVIKAIASDPALELQLFVTGMHLSPEFGNTYQLIEKDGFEITAKVESLLSSDTDVGVAKSTALGLLGFAEVFANHQPDIVVVLGDRFETLAATQAAFFLKIPVAHIHGGELTQGVLDESIRHAITKFSHIHFPVTEVYRRRLLQLGESPERVMNFGAPGLDYFVDAKLLSKDELEQSLGLKFPKRTLLATYHPLTLNAAESAKGLTALFEAIETVLDEDTLVIFTQSNADEGGRALSRRIEAFVQAHPARAVLFDTLGSKRYLSLLKVVDVMLGNSSSGLLEMPYLKKPTINIGHRQQGRLQADSVLSVPEDSAKIAAALELALSPEFLAGLENMQSPYGQGNASKKIVAHLKQVALENLCYKPFVDQELKADAI